MTDVKTIIKNWCAAAGMPEPSDGECHALEVALNQPSGNAGELPDEVRVPLDSLHADAAYLICRALDASLTADEVVATIRSRIDECRAALAAQAGNDVKDAARAAGRE